MEPVFGSEKKKKNYTKAENIVQNSSLHDPAIFYTEVKCLIVQYKIYHAWQA